jgi:hypothetical protein
MPHFAPFGMQLPPALLHAPLTQLPAPAQHGGVVLSQGKPSTTHWAPGGGVADAQAMNNWPCAQPAPL